MDKSLTLAELLPEIGPIAVRPAAGPCAEAIDAGAGLVIINAGGTPYDGLADAVARRPIGEALPRLAGLALGAGR